MKDAGVALLVEQDEGVASLIETLLREGCDMRAVLTRDPEEALKRINPHKPALILLDLDRPYHHDLESALEVRERARPLLASCDCPVIGLSAHFSAHELGDLGFDDFIRKPFDIDVFFAKVERCRQGSPA